MACGPVHAACEHGPRSRAAGQAGTVVHKADEPGPCHYGFAAGQIRTVLTATGHVHGVHPVHLVHVLFRGGFPVSSNPSGAVQFRNVNGEM
jgi:hypothetical protein